MNPFDLQSDQPAPPLGLETLKQLDTSSRKTERVRRILEAHVYGSGMEPNEKLVSERQLAEQLGVSYMTLRRGVSELVEAGILERRVGKGVFFIGRRPKSLHCKRVSLIYQDCYNFENSYLKVVISTLESVLESRGYESEVITTRATDDEWFKESQLAQRWQRQEVAGAILVSRYPALQILNLKASGVPFVWFGNKLGHDPIHSVLIDIPRGVLQAMRLLLAGPDQRDFYLIARDSQGVYRRSCSYGLDAGLISPEQNHYLELPRASGALSSELKQTLQQICHSSKPLAIFMPEDRQAIDAILAHLHCLGTVFPDQVSFLATHLPPKPGEKLPHSSICAPITAMAEKSLELLDQIIRDPDFEPYSHYICPDLINGDTTR